MSKTLTVTGFLVRNGQALRREELSIEEQYRLAGAWNQLAMKAAGCMAKNTLAGSVGAISYQVRRGIEV